MKICGLQKTTLLDFPGHVAATVFTGGCNFRCPFCHNSELLPGTVEAEYETGQVLEPGVFSGFGKEELEGFAELVRPYVGQAALRGIDY